MCSPAGRRDILGARDGQLHLDADGHRDGGPGLGARSAVGGDAGDGHVCRPADLHLFDRLHGARRELHALLLLPVAVCRGDAGRGDCEQPAAAVHVLGTGGTHVVSADRVLVSEAVGRRGGEEGFSHHARWRYFLSSGNCLVVRADGDAALLQQRRRIHRAGRADRIAGGARGMGIVRGRRRLAC